MNINTPKQHPELECLSICGQIEEVLMNIEDNIRPVLMQPAIKEPKNVNESESAPCELKIRLKGILSIICDIRSRIDL